jgi:hypothetical protein
MSEHQAHIDLPDGVSASSEVSLDELQLSQRNHGMHLEGLRYNVTPAGMLRVDPLRRARGRCGDLDALD